MLCGNLVKNEKKKRGDGFASEGRTTRVRLGSIGENGMYTRINLLGLGLGVLVRDEEEGVFLVYSLQVWTDSLFVFFGHHLLHNLGRRCLKS